MTPTTMDPTRELFSEGKPLSLNDPSIEVPDREIRPDQLEPGAQPKAMNQPQGKPASRGRKPTE